MTSGARGGGFDPDWLALREPADQRARKDAFLAPLVSEWRLREWSRVLDLGSGTGSNLRYLAPRLPGDQSWTLLDQDGSLLDRAPASVGAVGVRRVTGDLAREGLRAVEEADLVTGSALLDLVSEAWLAELARTCRERSCGVLFALTYDGTVVWSPEHEDDAFVLRAVNAHQHGDKGLGPALGPTAGARAEALLGEGDARVWTCPTPWSLGPAHRSLALELIDGWAAAASEVHADEASRIEAWRNDRQTTVASGAFELTVGHVDVLALPPT